MQILETTFNNFRCFKGYKIEYGIQTTVFIGKNGTGKSSILSGLRRGLSFMFAKPKNYSSYLSASNNSVVKSFDVLEANFDSLNRKYNFNIKNDFKAIFFNKDLVWSMSKKTMNGGLIKTLYSDALNTVLSRYNADNMMQLPLIAVFSDSFPHEKINLGAKVKKIINQEILPRDFGYYAWDERTNCIELWLTRLEKVANYNKDLKNDIKEIEELIFFYEKRIDWKDEYDEHEVPKWKEKIVELNKTLEQLNKKIELLKNDKRNEAFNKERLFVENKLIEFTKPLSDKYDLINKDFEIYRLAVNKRGNKRNSLEFSFTDERNIAFETLPMGYKRVFSIVIDLAYRSYILNEDIESEGVALIDEIELHLHPTLQQEILQRLRRTFPKIQFIVTTHSPLVISNFKSDENNKIIKLMHNGNDYSSEVVDNIYGIDYSTGLTEVMGAKYRASTIDNLIDSIVILASRNRHEDAEKIKKELYTIVGENNAHIKTEIESRIEMNKK